MFFRKWSKESKSEQLKGFLRGQCGLAFYGVIFWFPLIILIFLLSLALGTMEKYGQNFLVLFLPSQFLYPGLGIISWILIFYLTGIFLKIAVVRKFLSRIPFLGIFLKSGGGQVITLDRLLKLTPCIFLYTPTCAAYGWILSEQKIKISDIGRGSICLIHVYYPNIPTIIAGQVYPVRKEYVIKLANSSNELIDILLYNLSGPEYITYLPWEDETDKEFKARVKRLGLD